VAQGNRCVHRITWMGKADGAPRCIGNVSHAILGSQVCWVFWAGSHTTSTLPGPGCQVSPLVVYLHACANCPLSLSILSESDCHIDCYVVRFVVTTLSPIIVNYIASSSVT